MNKIPPFARQSLWALGCGLVTEALLWFWLMHVDCSPCSSRNLLEEIGLLSQFPGLLVLGEMVNAHTILGISIPNNAVMDHLAPVVCFSIQALLWFILWWMVLSTSRSEVSQTSRGGNP
jgi:hypothetical protein